jgi:hypothetical protein
MSIKKIIPWFGIPLSIGSDNELAFVDEVVQLMAKGLGITWKLHTAYCPQSSGKVECMNITLKSQLRKLCQETHLQWDQLLPIALLRIRSSPMRQMELSPFEVLYGCLSSLIKGIRGDLKEIGDLTLRQLIQTLRLTLSKINDWVWERLPTILITHTHTYRLGDAFWIKEWNVQLLKPYWRGPFVVILSTPTAVKLAGLVIGSTTAKSNQLLSNGSASLIQLHHVGSPSRT